MKISISLINPLISLIPLCVRKATMEKREETVMLACEITEVLAATLSFIKVSEVRRPRQTSTSRRG